MDQPLDVLAEFADAARTCAQRQAIEAKRRASGQQWLDGLWNTLEPLLKLRLIGGGGSPGLRRGEGWIGISLGNNQGTLIAVKIGQWGCRVEVGADRDEVLLGVIGPDAATEIVVRKVCEHLAPFYELPEEE